MVSLPRKTSISKSFILLINLSFFFVSGVATINLSIFFAKERRWSKISIIVLPLIYTNILIGGILVFVDILKELPITLLLRPFNFETLATYVYQYASDELLQESSFAALIIIVVGLGPVIFLNSTLQRVSQKKESN